MRKGIIILLTAVFAWLNCGLSYSYAGGLGNAIRKGAMRGLARNSAKVPARLFHATSDKAAASRIVKNGFQPAKMNPEARLGKGAYFGETRAAVTREVPGSKAVVAFKPNPYFEKHIWDIRNPRPALTNARLPESLRGEIKGNIVASSLGRQLGQVAGREGKIIEYHSGRNPGENSYFVPEKVLKEHSGILTSAQVINR